MIPFIVVASGKGLRAGGDLPKQFHLLDDKPILYHTLKNLKEAGVRKCVVVMDPSYEEMMTPFFQELDLSITTVPGGDERFISVRNGLGQIDEEEKWVAIHDGVRPFVSKELIESLLEKALSDEWDYVIPGNPVKDTMKEVRGERILRTRSRENLYGAGTPQLVRLSLYREGVEKNIMGTDDGMIVEAMGGRGILVPNDDLNRKLTTKEDLFLAPYMHQLFKKRDQ